VEYILDTLDYIQLHQEDLQEFQQLSNALLTRLDENQVRLETIGGDQLQTFNDDLEKYYEQVELLNQKGEILLQSSASNAGEENDNQIERLLENINRNYDSLTAITKVRLQQTDPVSPKTPSITTAEEIVRHRNSTNHKGHRSH
jgi:thioesterase domain-containing protein